jgi:uncharacterized protein (TIGR00730 family)
MSDAFDPKRVISVFGSSTPTADSVPYRQAYQVGQLLAQSGYAVATGGYSGTMAAVSQGAAESGGHVIGVTSGQIERWRPLGPNRWVVEEIRYDSLRDRLLHLVTVNDGMIVLPGGIGTLSEFALAWSLMQVGEIPARPLVLYGDIWPATVEAFVRPEYVVESHLQHLHFADTPETAVARVLEWRAYSKA